MSAIQAIILGFVQGLTEFLPISSSAHLSFIPALFNWQTSSQDFEIFLHAATLIAVMLYFRSDLKDLFTGFFAKDVPFRTEQRKIARNLLLAFLVLLPFMLLFNDIITLVDQHLVVSYLLLILFGIPLIFIEKIYRDNKKTITDIGIKESLLIGFSQCLALFSGVSRSGITIMTGLTRGLTKEAAKKFTFLLSIPTIAAGFFYELLKVANHFELQEGWGNVALGTLAAFISGWLAIGILMKFLKERSLAIFGYYRIVLGIILLIVYLV